MRTDLFPTQDTDSDKQANGTDIPNFSEAGTGKTITTLAAIEKSGIQNGLIVCPTIASLMWARLIELELGAKAQHLITRDTVIDPTADFLVVSYGCLEAHNNELYKRQNGVLVIDESHHVKNPRAQRTKILFGSRTDGAGGIYESSSQCWQLSGTPMERYADDLWAQLRPIQPEILARYHALSLDEFQLQFCKMVFKSFQDGAVSRIVSAGNENEALLKHMLYKEIGAIRRTMTEVDPFMPPAVEREIFVKHTAMKELKELLRGYTKEQLVKMIEADEPHIMMARKFMGLAKVRSMADYIRMEGRGKQLLVGFWHREVGKSLAEALKGTMFSVISGETSVRERESIRMRFMDGEVNILLGQIAAMGEAMDGLQFNCNHVIITENDWSHARIEQFYKRVKRLGQTLHTQVDFLKCSLALEDLIDEIRLNKKSGMEKVVG